MSSTIYDQYHINTPNEKWNNLSLGYYADYKPFTTKDGEGFRCSLYVSGCPFNCPGCFNKKAQSFRFGKPVTDELINKIFDDLSKPYVRGLSLLGGEPFVNVSTILPIVQEFRIRFGDTKNIWCWTGYLYEDLVQAQSELLPYIDVLVDGPFVTALKDDSCQWRGSSNQRVLSLT